MTIRCLAGAGLAAMATVSLAQDAADLPPPGPDDLAFSVANMDPSVDPGDDFYRYASGAWLDRVERPARLASYGIFDIMRDRVKQQMKIVLGDIGTAAATAPKGSPTQLVGDFYNASMATAARDAAGIDPIRAELDRIRDLSSLGEMAQFMGRMPGIDGPMMLAGFGPLVDLADSKHYAFYAVAGAFGIDGVHEDILADPKGSRRLSAYRTYLAEVLKVAGYGAGEAGRIADLSIAIETQLHAAKLTPEESVNPVNIYNPISFDDLQALIPELDLRLHFDALGYPVPQRLILTEPRYLPVLSKMLRERPLDDLKDYAALRMILAYQPVLTTGFDAPLRAFNEVMTGVPILPPRAERALETMQQKLGQPLSQVYVENFFTEETRATATDMIERIKAVFRKRIPTRAWLTDATRAEALDKLDRMTFAVGYPHDWIDYSAVEIGADPVRNLMNIAAFSEARLRARYDGAAVHDPFNDRSTLPIVVNAAYDSTINGFEVPAAILQDPAFPARMDAPVYVCRLGAIIGHEMTHGFDSGGRRSDADGNLRDWWSPEDAMAFDAEAQKLIDQANAFEVLPGLTANGLLNVRENMADVGGITFAHEALRDYLAEHPEEDVAIDGLTPDQRCFISWAQMWTGKATDQFVRTIVANDGHPPLNYRAVASLQHVDAFYEAFGIEAGDPMWLPPDQRVHAW